MIPSVMTAASGHMTVSIMQIYLHKNKCTKYINESHYYTPEEY